MGRISRRRLGRGVFHVFNRALDRRRLLADEADKQTLLDQLARFAAERDCVVYHWCLMSNHFHLAVEALRVADLIYVVGRLR